MTYHPRRIQTIAFLSLGVINVIVYALVFAASITKAIDGKLGEIIQAVYCCAFSIFLVFNELKAFSLSEVYFGFLNVYHGKGLLMLLLGCLVMCENPFNIIVTICGFTTGLGYVILSFISCVSLPKDICHCIHQYRNQKDESYYSRYQTRQRDVLIKYNTRPQGNCYVLANGFHYGHVHQKHQNYSPYMLSLDDSSEQSFFTLKSSNGSSMNPLHY